jgi:hypothetical protein
MSYAVINRKWGGRIFDRSVTKATPGPFPTRIITDGVIFSLDIDKGTRIKREVSSTCQRVAALRLADPTVQALWIAALMYDLLPAGLSTHLAHYWAGPRRASRRAA